MPTSGTPPQPADQAGSTDSTNHRPRRRRRPAVRLVLLTVIAVLLGASQAAPAVHLDPPDLSGLPEGAYVALGDSYASGFGVPPYAEGTDVTGGNTCRRSAGSYAHIVSERTRRPLEMGACSGARTRNFYEANESWGEAAQLDRRPGHLLHRRQRRRLRQDPRRLHRRWRPGFPLGGRLQQ